MEELGYLEAKELVVDDYNDFIEDEGFTPSQAIAATFEESVLMVRKSKKVYVSVIMTLAILSLKQNFIPDYLLERLDSLKEIDALNDEEKSIYEEEKMNLQKLLDTQNYSIDKDDVYKLRVNMLLE
ncbi:hypothetical protein [Bacillus sp. LK2]|uniref:hypothetical protein n=1 Tax=Bacillus sp. LK2 TaxID=1628206 RepID=UPI0006549A25|nr:hypothetical protein [Bacillus sp. LK2]KMN45617.1 hypothetical protein VK90_07885 [Bacillus sp. LK2]